MIVRNEGSIPTSELELSNEPQEVMTYPGPKPSTWAMIGHIPVVHCGSGVSVLPFPEQTHPCRLLDELVGVKTSGV